MIEAPLRSIFKVKMRAHDLLMALKRPQNWGDDFLSDRLLGPWARRTRTGPALEDAHKGLRYGMVRCDWGNSSPFFDEIREIRPNEREW